MTEMPILRSSKQRSVEDFNALKVGLASPDDIRRWSHGEVKKPETINYRTLKPERDGLFCAKIFGPVSDYECLCGKYKRPKHRGVICEKCGVEVTTKDVRRERMGHIELASPVTHIWFVKSVPSRMATLLDIDLKELERVVYFDSYYITRSDVPDEYPVGRLLTEEERRTAIQEHGRDAFSMEIGAEGIQNILRNEYDVDGLAERKEELLEAIANTNSETTRKKLTKRLKLINAFLRSNNKPEHMVLEALPVLPPDLRPLVPMEGGRFATSDLNDLYRRVISRNSRLARIIELRSPQIIERNEKRMLQEAVDSLLDNGRRGRAVQGRNKQPLKSLSDMIKGKQGRFRQNLLGKRVDYSGRSVIVVGPTLKLHECGLPKRMALELFRPFVYHELESRGFAGNTKMAKNMVDGEHAAVWEVLPDVIREHPVLLNRAPTLHRLSIQAFEPVLIEGKAIQLHPLVCLAFNADFDGDQMAVHVPLTIESQLESRAIMMSTNNILSPANGDPIIVPSEDIVLGLYYLTRETINGIGEGRVCADLEEVARAYASGTVELHAKIKVRVFEEDSTGEYVSEMYDTTVGRALLAEILPDGLRLSHINQVLAKDEISKLVDLAYRRCGLKDSVIFADRLMQMAFRYATHSGCSICIQDFEIPDEKESITASAMSQVEAVERDRENQFVTEKETYNRAVDIWTNAANQIGAAMMEELSTEEVVDAEGETVKQKSFNSVYMYADSKSRGSPSQLRQVAGMRGLMTKPSGEIIATPIVANFREGLKVNEYFMSTHGARKGLADTALKTSHAGYLTRRMVDVAQDLVITEQDCGTSNGLSLTAIINRGEVVEELSSRVLGRVLAEDVVDEETGELILERGALIDEDTQPMLARVNKVRVRSPVTCETRRGICAMCYGRDLARGHLVNIGEAVGVMAAQSIGEPGTQLTLRTFHHGGAASRIAGEDRVEITTDGTVEFEMRMVVRESDGLNISTSRAGEVIVKDNTGIERERYKVPYGSHLLVDSGQEVAKGDTVARWNPHQRPIIAENDTGHAIFIDFTSGETVTESTDEATGLDILEIKPESERAAEHRGTKPTIILVNRSQRESGDDVRTTRGGTVEFVNLETMAFDDTVFATSEGGSIQIRSKDDKTRTQFDVPVGSEVLVTPGQTVSARDQILLSYKLARFEMPENARIERAVQRGSFVERGAVLATVPISGSKNEDITGGLPKVIEFLEARKPKESAIVAEHSGIVSFGKETNLKNRLVITDDKGEEWSKLINKTRPIAVFSGERVEQGEVVCDGPINPHDILEYRGIEELTDFIVNGIQEVYRLQGVLINDKHIEIIVHQMLRKVEILSAGDSDFVRGDQVERAQFLDVRDELLAEGKEAPRVKQVLLPIRRASLETESFISAASFQETTKILTDAAVHGKLDELRGLKENVIVGRLIPAGTGLEFHKQVRQKADRQKVIDEARAQGMSSDELEALLEDLEAAA